jgi:hypothetical protein
LSGRYPPGHRVRFFYQLLDSEVPLIPELLPADWTAGAFVSNVVLTDEALGIADRFDHYDDFVDERESIRKSVYQRKAERTTDAALAWLSAVPRDRPLFLWVHYIDPHGPYRAPDGFGRFTHQTAVPFDATPKSPMPRATSIGTTRRLHTSTGTSAVCSTGLPNGDPPSARCSCSRQITARP